MSSDDLSARPGSRAVVARAGSAGESEGVEYTIEQAEDRQSFAASLGVVRRHLVLVFGVALLAAGLRGWQLLRTIPVYRAQATVRFKDTRSNLIANVGSNPTGEYPGTADIMKSNMELLSSRTVAEEATDRGKLQLRELTKTDAASFVTELDAGKAQRSDTLTLTFDESAVLGNYGPSTGAAPYGSSLQLGAISLIVSKRPPDVKSARFVVMPRDSAANMVQGHVVVRIREETDIADIAFTSPDPAFAQRAVNAMTLALQTVGIRSSQQGARARREFIEAQLRKSDSILAVQRAQLSNFRSSTGAYSSKDKIEAQQQSLASIDIRRAELEADRQVYQSLLARAMTARRGSGDGLKTLVAAPGIAANPVIMQLYSQFAELARSRDSLMAGPFPAASSSPDVQRLNSLIAGTSDQLVNAVKSQIEGLDARINSLSVMSSKSAAQVSVLPKSEAEESRLVQEAEGTQKMAEQLQEEEQRARISEVAQGGQLEVIDLARLPRDPVSLGKFRKLTLAAVMGLLLGVGLAFLRDDLNSTLRGFDDVERVFQIPTLAVLPNLGGQGSKALRVLGFPLKTRMTNGKRRRSLGLVTPDMPAFEAFRSLRTSLIFSNAVKSLKTIVVASAAPGDGKSTTTANLAAAFAQQGMRVLVIDCDFRRGCLHTYFGVPRSPGLTNIVLGESDLMSTVHETSVPNLSILASGANPPNSTELLGSEPVRQILMQAVNEYELVIIDSPPLLATADASILSSIADGVLIVARMGVTDRDAAKRALQRLNLVGARMVGTVINDPANMLGSAEEYYYAYASSENGA